MLTANDTKLDTLALLILFTFWSYSSVQWFFSVPFTSFFGFALLYPRLRTSWLFWSLMTALLGFVIGQIWATEGSATFLFFYTSLAMVLALVSEKPWEVLQFNGRFLIGLVFLFATIWKLLSPDFVSGKFMEFFLLTDGRVAPVAIILTPLTVSDARENRERLEDLPKTPTRLNTAQGVRTLARVLTYLTLLVEGLVAFVFLLPINNFWRDVVLIVFLVGGYLTVTVPSFGMILACLGFAQTRSSRMQVAYQVICLLLPLISLRFFLSS